MHPKKGPLKKLLIVYIVSVSMVLVYFIIKTFIPQDKEITLKSFTKEPVYQEVTSQEDEDLMAEVNNSRRFLLLPTN